jgi:hypothetical protein
MAVGGLLLTLLPNFEYIEIEEHCNEHFDWVYNALRQAEARGLVGGSVFSLRHVKSVSIAVLEYTEYD